MKILVKLLFFIIAIAWIKDVEAQASMADFSLSKLWGYWKVIRIFDATGYPLSHEAQISCNDEGLYFCKDSVVASRGCMHAKTCFSPKYSVSYISVAKVFDKDDKYIKMAGFKTDSIWWVNIESCDHPIFFHAAFLDSDKILTGADNTSYILQRHEGRFDLNSKKIDVKRASLYSQPSDAAITKAYLIKGDIVEVLQNNIYWIQIKYTSPETNNSMIRWVKPASIGLGL